VSDCSEPKLEHHANDHAPGTKLYPVALSRAVDWRYFWIWRAPLLILWQPPPRRWHSTLIGSAFSSWNEHLPYHNSFCTFFCYRKGKGLCFQCWLPCYLIYTLIFWRSAIPESRYICSLFYTICRLYIEVRNQKN